MELLTRAMGGDTSITPLQMQAAVAAAPYIHPRLVAQTTTLQGPNGGPVETASKTVTITTTDPTEAAKAYAKFVSGT